LKSLNIVSIVFSEKCEKSICTYVHNDQILSFFEQKMKEKMENHVYMLKVNGLSLEFVKSYLGDYDFLKVVAKQCVHALRNGGMGV